MCVPCNPYWTYEWRYVNVLDLVPWVPSALKNLIHPEDIVVYSVETTAHFDDIHYIDVDDSDDTLKIEASLWMNFFELGFLEKVDGSTTYNLMYGDYQQNSVNNKYIRDGDDWIKLDIQTIGIICDSCSYSR